MLNFNLTMTLLYFLHVEIMFFIHICGWHNVKKVRLVVFSLEKCMINVEMHDIVYA